MLDVQKHYHDLPVVCEDPIAVSKFKHHHLRVHMQHGLKFLRSEKMLSFIMLASDLPRFCGVLMRWQFLMMVSPSTTLMTTTPDAAPVQLPAPPDYQGRPIQTKIQLRPTRYKSLTVELERYLLAPFQDMIIEYRGITSTVGPLYVSVAPMVWRVDELPGSIKRAADESVAQRRLSHALDRSALITETCYECYVTLLPPSAYGPESRVAIAVLSRRVMDAAVTSILLRLRLGDIEGAAAAWDTVASVRSCLLYPLSETLGLPEDGRHLACRQGQIWLIELLFFVGERNRNDLTPLAGRLQALLRDMAGSPHLPALLHDIRYITTMSAELKDWYARTMGDTAANEALFDALSVRQFPPQVFNTPVPEGWTKPQDFDGFLEQGHKEYLQEEGLL